MTNPVLVEATRGGRVESRHRGALAVVDADGKRVLALGDADEPVFPRSAVKVLQALPLVESGAADRFALGACELALVCASHAGEPDHASLAADILARAGLGEPDLECGCHWPFAAEVARRMAEDGVRPTQLHNNCSGKHAGFLCTAAHLGEPTEGYVGLEHPVQERVRGAMEEATGARLDPAEAGIDGCSIPTFAAPLAAFALAFARLGSGVGVGRERAAAGRRLIDACIAEPWFMAGTRRACTDLIRAGQGRVFAKTGAEGVFCGAVPDLGIGFALKIDDGATRASETAVAALLARLFRDEDDVIAGAFAAEAGRPLRNWRKDGVGELRATEAFQSQRL